MLPQTSLYLILSPSFQNNLRFSLITSQQLSRSLDLGIEVFYVGLVYKPGFNITAGYQLSVTLECNTTTFLTPH